MSPGRGVKVGPGGYGALRMIESARAGAERPSAAAVMMSNLFTGRRPVGLVHWPASSPLFVAQKCAVGAKNLLSGAQFGRWRGVLPSSATTPQTDSWQR